MRLIKSLREWFLGAPESESRPKPEYKSPFRDKYELYWHGIERLGGIKERAEAYSREHEFVYISPLDKHSQEAAAAIFAHLVEGDINAVHSIFNRKRKNFSVTEDLRYEMKRRKPKNVGFIAVSFERKERDIEVLLDRKLRELGIRDIFYTWFLSGTGYEILSVPEAPAVSTSNNGRKPLVQSRRPNGK